MSVDGYPGVEAPAKKSPAEAFEEMAKRIRHNNGSPFGGAVVIVPPEGGGAVVSMFTLDDTVKVGDFWVNLSSRIQSEVADLDAQRQSQNPYMRR